jgi:hypothetical protein
MMAHETREALATLGETGASRENDMHLGSAHKSVICNIIRHWLLCIRFFQLQICQPAVVDTQLLT